MLTRSNEIADILQLLAPEGLKGNTMDPDAALAELRGIIEERDLLTEVEQVSDSDLRKHADILENKLCRVQDLFDGLDQWLSKGGFKPRSWR